MPDIDERIAPAAVVVAFVVSALAYSHLPAVVPVHWGIGGQPDEFGSRLTTALQLPLLMLAMWTVLKLLPKRDIIFFVKYRPRPEDDRAVRPEYERMASIVLSNLLALHLYAIASGLSLLPARQQPRIMAMLLSVSMIVVGNYLPRITRRNLFFGVRMPWTFASEDIWRRTQRIGGYAYVATGVVGLIGALAVPASPLKPLMVALVIQVVAVAAYSYWLAHTPQNV